MKRIFLFLATNIAILVVISIVLAVLGINSRGGAGSLLAYSAVVGFTGSIISLLMSKFIAKQSVGAEVIDTPRTEEEAWLLNTVEAQARQWNLKTPEVAIYRSPEPNAFATGASRNSSLIAVSTGLLDHMTRDEVEAVLAHEMAHVGNGDMVIADADSRRGQYLCRIPVAHYCQPDCPKQRRQPVAGNLLPGQRGVPNPVRLPCQLNCHVVQPPARIPRRCGGGKTGRRAENDFRPAKA